MKTIALICLSGALLFAAATPANAHQAGRYDYDPPGRYQAQFERRHEMPRWLRHQRSFRHWYRESPYKRRRALSWARLYDIYRWERRYARRHRYDHYGRDDHYSRDDMRRNNRRHRH